MAITLRFRCRVFMIISRIKKFIFFCMRNWNSGILLIFFNLEYFHSEPELTASSLFRMHEDVATQALTNLLANRKTHTVAVGI